MRGAQGEGKKGAEMKKGAGGGRKNIPPGNEKKGCREAKKGGGGAKGGARVTGDAIRVAGGSGTPFKKA